MRCYTILQRRSPCQRSNSFVSDMSNVASTTSDMVQQDGTPGQPVLWPCGQPVPSRATITTPVRPGNHGTSSPHNCPNLLTIRISSSESPGKVAGRVIKASLRTNHLPTPASTANPHNSRCCATLLTSFTCLKDNFVKHILQHQELPLAPTTRQSL